jgi:hypothetical protein
VLSVRTRQAHETQQDSGLLTRRSRDASEVLQRWGSIMLPPRCVRSVLGACVLCVARGSCAWCRQHRHMRACAHMRSCTHTNTERPLRQAPGTLCCAIKRLAGPPPTPPLV